MHATTSEPSEPTTGTITKTCQGCNKPFPFLVTEAHRNWPMLIPSYCPSCEDAREREWKRRQEEERFARLEKAWKQLCPPEMQDTNRDRLPQVPLARAMAWRPQKKGLTLFGDTGLGKTRVLWELLKELHFEEREFLCLRASEFSRKIEEASSYSHDLERLTKLYASVPILALDDLGKERRTGRIETTLFDIIDLRSIHQLPTIVTTNFVGEQLAERYTDKELGAALVRRLRDYSIPVSFGMSAKEAAK